MEKIQNYPAKKVFCFAIFSIYEIPFNIHFLGIIKITLQKH